MTMDRREPKRSAHARGYTRRWDAYAKQFRRQHPLCGEQHDGTFSATHSRCVQEGRTTAANVVDHKRPHRGDMVLFWDVTNHQSLCDACHAVKTRTEWGGGGKSLRPDASQTRPGLRV